MEKTAYPIKEFFSKGGHLASPWDNLSIREKAEMMKVAVRNGITNLPDIKQKYNEFAEGGEIESPVENSNIYAGGSYLDIAKQHIKKNEGWLAKPYRDAPKGKNWRSVGYGFNDSGFRNKYPQGISKHYENGITKAQAEEELNWFLGGVVNHLKKVYGRKWDSFNDNQKAAIIDTYYQRPASVVGKGSQFYRAVMAGDKNAGNYLGVAGYGNRNKDRRKLFGASQIESVAPTQEVLPISEPIQSMPEDTFDFIPWNPQAFFGVNNNTPIIIHQEAPVVEEKVPTPEEIERQERQQGLANFQTIMGMLNSTSDNTSNTLTPFESTVSMLTQQSPIHYFSDGGSIHIKPSHRGKFTALKERTGHSASWFKENGTPAQKKMAIFALNSRHWKHGLGGNLFDDGGIKAGIPVDYLDPSEVMPLVADNMGKSIVLDEQVVTPYKKLPMQSDFFEGITNQAAKEEADTHAAMVAPTAEDLFTIGTLGGLSNLSPTQWARRAYDLGEAIKGNILWDNFGNNWFYGNNGLVSDEYTQEHPYASAAINLVGDVGAFGTLSALKKLPKYATASTPQITAENAASITPKQWTAAQDAAIARGNMAEAQRLRDLHFKVLSGENPTHFYRGSRKGSRNTYYRNNGSAVWLTPDDDAAAFYTNDRIKDLYLKSDPSLITIDGKGSKHNMIPKELLPKDISNLVDKPYVNTTEVAHYAKKAGHNQVNFINVEDFARTRIYPYPQTATRNYGNIKSADAVTYDDNGVRIPLGDRDNFSINDIRYYESPNREAMKGIKYIEQTPSATSLDAEQQLVQRLKSYTPKIGENGLVGYKPLNSGDVVNIPEEAIERQIQKFVDSGMERESAIEYLREQFGYGAMTQNGKTFLLPEKYMITNPEYMKAHDAIHRVLRFDDSFSIPGAEGLNPNEAVAMISGEIKPALGIRANEPLTEEMLDKWLKTTNEKITGRYGFSSKIKDKKKFLKWANITAPVVLPFGIGLTGYGLYNSGK